jgi:hypothetical protein
MKITIKDIANDFAEDKDVAARIREEHIRTSIDSGRKIILDFTGVTLTTQSFLHALISDILRSRGESALDKIVFKGCNRGVQGLIKTVVQYSLETIDEG